MHFTAFDLWVNNLRTKMRRKKSHQWIYMLSVQSIMEKRKQSERGDRQGRRVRETNSDDTLADLSARSYCGWRSLSCPCGFYCSGSVTYALLYIPLYFKHILSLRSAEHTAATLTFIDVRRIHVMSVWVGNKSSLLKTDNMHTNRKKTDG